MNIGVATEVDIPELYELVQGCYRGEGSKEGWTHEADLLDGNRTTPEALRDEMNVPGASILKFTDQETEKIIGCVYTEHKVEKRALYVGMLCVKPKLQGRGLGRQLMTACEQKAKQFNCTKLSMTVISVRTELIEWYERMGFHRTGETAPFPGCEQAEGELGAFGTPVFGIPKRKLEFVILEKKLQ